MQAQRRARLQAVIIEELSHFISREIKDPRVPTITITQVEVTSDASVATIRVMIFGGVQAGTQGLPPLSEAAAAQRMADCLAGLNSAAGFMKRHLGRVLSIKQIPNLIFKEDKGIENVSRVHELLRQIETKPKTTEE